MMTITAALAESPASQSYPIEDTGYHIALPADWMIEKSAADPAQALLIAKNETMQLYLWMNRQDGRSLADWQAASLKASSRNSVLEDSFSEEKMAERTFVRYRYERENRVDGARSVMYVMELEPGVFLTFEFCSDDEFSAFDRQGESLGMILGSLEK
ncbi:MAG: hypothetical protein PHI98_16800 [Eubacteriales bacterium]|nr:hypothetical protein [Eubacteriales bacterium]